MYIQDLAFSEYLFLLDLPLYIRVGGVPGVEYLRRPYIWSETESLMGVSTWPRGSMCNSLADRSIWILDVSGLLVTTD